MANGVKTFDDWCRSWLERHPEPGVVSIGLPELTEVWDKMAAHDVEDRPAAEACWLTPSSRCDAQGATCGICPAYAVWRASLPARGWT